MPPATDWREVVPDGENARFEQHAAALGALQRKPDRALHAKQNLGLEAEFEILSHLPPEAAVGLFATPKKYAAVARFSNGAGRRQPDKVMDVRGLAVKLFGVDGKKVIPGLENARTQDFLAIRTPSLPVRNAEEFFALVRAAQSPALLPIKLMASLGIGRAFKILGAALRGFKLPQAPLWATGYFSALPIKYGPYAVQFSFMPTESASPLKLTRPDHLGEELTERLQKSPVAYDFRVRFYKDPESTPIENAFVEWNAEWVTVARLTLPVQDATSPRGKKVDELVERLSFDPWHAREDLRPLGNMMRARNIAYRVSTQARGAAPEPEEAPRFD
jgi:hypothetical protein